MGDLPKPSDDPAWTEVERSFFAAAPPEEPAPLEEAPCFEDLPAPPRQRARREIIAWLRPSLAAAWRRTTLAFGAAGGHVQRVCCRTALFVRAAGVSARRGARAVAAGLVAALSIWSVDRRRVVFALAGAIMVAGLAAGGVAFRKGALTNGATAPNIAAAPVAISASEVALRSNVRSSADVRAPRSDVSNRRSHARRRSVAASSSAQRPVVTANVDRETYWAHETQSAPIRAPRSLFSR